MTYLSSPTMIIGNFGLKEILVILFLRLETIACTHIGLYLLTLRSNTQTLPSLVTAANTVEEYGAHLTSPTLSPTSNTKRGSLEVIII